MRIDTVAGRLLALLIALGVAAGVILVSVRALDDAGPGSSASSTIPPTSTPATSSTTTALGGDLPLGVLTPGGSAPAGCPSGFDCSSFQVTCPGVAGSSEGTLAVRLPPDPRGLVVLFSGGIGDEWWSTGQGRPAMSMFGHLTEQGLGLVQVRWPDGWLVAPPGAEVGPATLACRPATVAAWIHGNLYKAAVGSDHAGTCGFCLTGNSGGASQVAYALTRYGLAPLIDGAVVTSGPPHTSLDAGCGIDSSDPALLFGPREARTIDASYGAAEGGPCTRHDVAFQARFAQDSVDGVPSPNLDGVRLRLIVGAEDHTSAPSHARVFAQWIGDLDVVEVPGMTHPIQQSQAAVDRLADELSG
ncbi:MAG: hypothetical protein ACRDZU_16610 [Acidimicrobiales bacterium]